MLFGHRKLLLNCGEPELTLTGRDTDTVPKTSPRPSRKPMAEHLPRDPAWPERVWPCVYDQWYV